MDCICGNNEVVNGREEKGVIVDTEGIEQSTLLSLVECSRCGVVRQINLPFNTAEEYIKYYSEKYPPSSSKYKIKDYEHDENLAKLRYGAYKIKEGSRLLDVGSGSGAFVDICRQNGIEAYGCEITEYFYRKRNTFIYKKSFEDINFPTDYFDLITCHDMLEHVLDPIRIINELFRSTKQEGKCIIDIPRFFHKEGKHHWKDIEHIWFFSTGQLEKILNGAGFNIDSVEHPIESKTVFYLSKPKQNRIKILVPPGIGDSYWVITKLQSFIEREGLGIPDIYVACNEDHKFKSHLRSFPFIEMFPFLNASWEVVSDPELKELWLEAYIRRGRTIYREVCGCDYFISYNGILESGLSLDQVDTDLKCNWNMPMFISLEQDKYRTECLNKYGKYVLLYFTFQGSFINWINEFSLDRIKQSLKKLFMQRKGFTPVFAGALWDRDDKDLDKLIKSIPNSIDLRNDTTVEQLFGLIKGSESIIGYPCGLTMMAASFGKKTLMIWNNFHRDGFKLNTCPPYVKDKTYFIENTKALTENVFINKCSELIDKKDINIESIDSCSNRLYKINKKNALNNIEKYKIKGKDKVLCINSTDGAFVDACKEKKLEAYGCETTVSSYNKSTENNFIYKKSFEDVNFPTDYFDFIIVEDSFGYTIDPILFMKEIFRVLKQKGRCIIPISKRKHTNIWFYNFGKFRQVLKDIGFTINSEEDVDTLKKIYYVEKPQQERIKILVAPGIGDSYWSIIKLQSFIERNKIGIPDVFTVCPREKKYGAHERAIPFLQMFPFLNSAGSFCNEDERKGLQIWHEGYHEKKRTVFKNVLGYDYFISFNGYLKEGESLEKINPEYKCNWFPPMFVSLEQENYKKFCIEKYGRYIVLHFSFVGSYKNWIKEFSIDRVIELVVRVINETGYTPVFVGAKWDSDDKEFSKVINSIKKIYPKTAVLVGKTSVDQLFGLLKGSSFVLGYPSGLTIMSTVFKLKTLIIWNRYYHNNFAWYTCPPSVRNRTYFIENTRRLIPEKVAMRIGRIILGKERYEEPKIKQVGNLYDPIIDIDTEDSVTGQTRQQVIRKSREVRNISKRDLIEDEGLDRSIKTTIVCMYRKDSEFNIEYVVNLKSMLKRNVTINYDLICYTDQMKELSKYVNVVDLNKHSLIDLFNPKFIKTDYVVYVDLDIVIMLNIDDLLLLSKDFITLHPWHSANLKNGPLLSFIRWNQKRFSFIYKNFKDPNNNGHEDVFSYLLRSLYSNNIDYYPLQKLVDGIYSYKKSCKRSLPSGTKLVFFHGRPLLHNCKRQWIRNNWR